MKKIITIHHTLCSLLRSNQFWFLYLCKHVFLSYKFCNYITLQNGTNSGLFLYYILKYIYKYLKFFFNFINNVYTEPLKKQMFGIL